MDQAQAAACTSAAAAPPSLDATTVTLRVFNATPTAGLATTVAEALQGRGFVVSEIGNDGTSREVTGVGEVRFGARGRDAGRFLSLQQPGIPLHQDTRATATVDLVIGPAWDQLATPEEVTQALAAQSAEPSDC